MEFSLFSSSTGNPIKIKEAVELLKKFNNNEINFYDINHWNYGLLFFTFFYLYHYLTDEEVQELVDKNKVNQFFINNKNEWSKLITKPLITNMKNETRYDWLFKTYIKREFLNDW
ncbi:hypothetical protein [Mesomycoplasma lagogenitalium]|uniref:Uncharacterized protein n=1 Tax=Mesomycoplasma lagogenitalium TaxID=171286 RepID=A0ABY8LT84_9BACT|nr:hypothetical protein [Mesomycoplasma lagogenitalium]WGI36460.1 hypothetical protein QEG99_03275 [Mesomycoplasma lagogenitalium]